MPVCDCRLTQFPAEKQNFALHLAGEIKQANVDVFHLNAGGIDFGERILHPANRLLAFRLAACQVHHIQQRAAIKKNTMRRLLQLIVYVFNKFLAIDCLAKQRFKNR